jgi:16S rRNA (guanine527-N7)-methyltransferase
MSNVLRPLGPAWHPLLEGSVDALARAGLDVAALWLSPAERREALERLATLLDLVVTWNARIDLTAARSERELVDLYLVDALVLAAREAQSLAGTKPRWVDVGSGAGAPGLALSLLWPVPTLTLVEPRQKRVAFLRSAGGRFPALAPARIVEGRSDVVPSWSHDVAVSRATFSPDEWLKEGARLARHRVWVLLARAAPPALAGWHVLERIDYEWPLTHVARTALVFGRDGAIASQPSPPDPSTPISPSTSG